MFCRRCGADIPVDSVFCPSCGTNLILNEAEPSEVVSDDETVLSRSQGRSRRAWLDAMRRGYQAGISGVTRIGQVWSGPRKRQIGLNRVLAIGGVVFGLIGFMVGLMGHTRGLDWLLFGLILILAAIYVSISPVPTDKKSEPKELTD